jgi:molecular chaperone DnaJ
MSEDKPSFDGVFDDFESMFGDLFAGRRKSSGRGADLRVETKLTLHEAAHGLTKTLDVPRETPCPMCRGTGGLPGATFETCSRCEGRGQALRTQGAFRITAPCEACGGTRGQWSRPCGVCEGRGVERGTRQVDVTVPPGVRPGQRLRLQGLGRAPLPDARGPDGAPAPAGDLYVVLDITLPRGLAIDGDDLVVTVRLDPAKAQRGGILHVPWIEGSTRVEVPAGTPHEARIVKRGWGLAPLGVPFSPPPDDAVPYRANQAGPRGDLVVVVSTTADPEKVLETELAATPPTTPAGYAARRGPPAEVRALAIGLAFVAATIGYLLLSR